MKNLILEYAETANCIDQDFSLIEYSHCKSLNVIKNTEIPAITVNSLQTNTMTKADGETNDADNDFSQLKSSLETATQTFNDGEGSVGDPSTKIKALLALMSTQTLTEAREGTDSDK